MEHKHYENLVDNQRLLSKGKGTLGPLGNMADNGCGVVALYNILVFLEGNADFSALLSRISKAWPWAMAFGGRLGILPWFVCRYLKKRGYHLKRYRRVERRPWRLDEENRHRAYLILYLWRDKHRVGAHYQAAWRAPDGRLLSWNDFGADDGFASMVRRKSVSENLFRMWVWGID